MLVKLAPIVTPDRLGNPELEQPGRTMYWRNALGFLPGRSEVPLVVDHDMSRQIGVLDQLFPMDWVDGWWIVACGTVTDAPASLEKYQTKASFGHWNVHISENRVSQAWVKEVSLLSPAVEPAEPLACVLSVRPAEPKPSPAAVASDRAVAGEVIYGKPGERIVRYFETPITVR